MYRESEIIGEKGWCKELLSTTNIIKYINERGEDLPAERVVHAMAIMELWQLERETDNKLSLLSFVRKNDGNVDGFIKEICFAHWIHLDMQHPEPLPAGEDRDEVVNCVLEKPYPMSPPGRYCWLMSWQRIVALELVQELIGWVNGKVVSNWC